MSKAIVLIALFFTGCASYQTRVAPARDLLVSGQCDASLKILDELSAKDDGDQLVHMMDYGSALQICGDYKKSNDVFNKAEKLVEQNDVHSVSRIAGATLLNEEMIQYKGDTFEKLFLNVSLALNYLQLGLYDDALVEVRRMNQKFVKLQGEDKKNYELNPFSKYLSGMIWEGAKKNDDACIDFRDAYFLDTFYRRVGLDALRSCSKAKRSREFDEISKKLNATPDEIKSAKQNGKGELVLIFMQGWGPRKQPRPENHIFPYLVSVTSRTQFLKAELLDSDKKTVSQKFESEPVYSVEKAAIATLDADYSSLVARRVGARVAKEVVADQIRQKDKLLGNLAWLAMVASERADLRQWSIFPKSVHVIRMPLDSGPKTIRLSGMDAYMNPSESLSEITISVKPGEKRFQLIRSLQ